MDLSLLSNHLTKMLHSPVHNYVIPGLTSSLVGGPNHGRVRMFSQERYHEEPITPHSHRFDFVCLVLEGSVANIRWTANESGDLYQATTLQHHGSFGDQTRHIINTPLRFVCEATTYKVGECYGMEADEIHSIFFSRGAKVLFFEGPNYSDESLMLEPIVDGKVIPTFKVEPWMFRRES